MIKTDMTNYNIPVEILALRIPELKEELEARSLNTYGLKKTLQGRLAVALAAEKKVETDRGQLIKNFQASSSRRVPRPPHSHSHPIVSSNNHSLLSSHPHPHAHAHAHPLTSLPAELRLSKYSFPLDPPAHVGNMTNNNYPHLHPHPHPHPAMFSPLPPAANGHHTDSLYSNSGSSSGGSISSHIVQLPLRGFPAFGVHTQQQASFISHPPISHPPTPVVAKSGPTAAGGAISHPSSKSVRGPPGCNIFLYNLPQSYTVMDVTSLFSPFGEILSVTVQQDELGRSRCFGFVSFRDRKQAQKAISSLDGTKLNGKRLAVRLKKGEESRNPGSYRPSRNSTARFQPY